MSTQLVTPDQCRRVRAFLDWSYDDLADLACISAASIRDFEEDRKQAARATLVAIARAIQTLDIRFVGNSVVRTAGSPAGGKGSPQAP